MAMEPAKPRARLGGSTPHSIRRAVQQQASISHNKKNIAFGWYGGKFSHLDFIVPNIPHDSKAVHFCDVFGGSGAVIMNVTPYAVETYNDLDGELVNFFEVLRNHGKRLVQSIEMTPFSRQELIQACEPLTGRISKIERARRFYIRARQTRTGLAQRSSVGRWAHCVLTSRAGMSGSVSRWLGSVNGLTSLIERLRTIQIENAPAIEVIERYDSPRTVFYLDPPYMHVSRGDASAYGYEMTDEEHIELAKALHRIKGRAVLSGYRTGLYDDLYADWVRVDAPAKTCHSVKQVRRESIWKNFDI